MFRDVNLFVARIGATKKFVARIGATTAIGVKMGIIFFFFVVEVVVRTDGDQTIHSQFGPQNAQQGSGPSTNKELRTPKLDPSRHWGVPIECGFGCGCGCADPHPYVDPRSWFRFCENESSGGH